MVLWFDRGDSAPRLRVSYSDEDASSSIIPKRRGGGRGRIFFRRWPADDESGIRSGKWVDIEDGITWSWDGIDVIGARMGMIEEITVIECDVEEERRDTS